MDTARNPTIGDRRETRLDISILLPTCKRTQLIERCLDALLRQRTTQTFEVVVIDNAPGGNSARDWRKLAPNVRLVNEPRRGLSYARNAGIKAALGKVLVFTDDDTVASCDWLENLVSPLFLRREVAAVTGQTLPLKLQTEAERLFEAYGGLGRGDTPAEFDLHWLNSNRSRLPLWQMGTTANAAFRADIFSDPAVGLLEERLGAGGPAGAWEDLYLFYRILRAGHVIVYQPSAKIFHAHRESLPELCKQLQAYRRGEIAFCLLAIRRERESRALSHLLLWIPYWRAAQLLGELLRRARGESRFQLSMMIREWGAYLSGPAALFLAHRRVRRLARKASAKAANG
jgi:O-antigen biosynthesis protein